MTPEDRIRQLEQQKAKYAAEAYGQGTESGKYNHGCQEPVSADDLDQEGEDVPEERVLQICPILLSIKNMLDILERELDQAKEPELVKAVKYALKEYPCLLHCLQNGALDFSNNCVEREIRRLAKYRNNSFYAGSPEGGVRLARTLTTFANCKAYNIDPYKYLCDVFRRIKNTAKDELVNLVAHRWQPQMAVAAY